MHEISATPPPSPNTLPLTQTPLPKSRFIKNTAALERDAEKLVESTSELTQRVLEAVAKAERAGEKERDALAALARAEEAAGVSAAEAVAAAREEEAARCRREMETALAEVSSYRVRRLGVIL